MNNRGGKDFTKNPNLLSHIGSGQFDLGLVERMDYSLLKIR
jgi:hypothetical protein